MSYERWLELLRELARASGSEDSLEWDATPLDGLLITIDGYASSASKLPWMSWSDWGWKAAVAAIADVAAAGGKPLAIAYSIGVASPDEAREIAEGVGDAARWAGVRVAKSDTNLSRGDRWIDVAVVGRAQRPVSRSGARPGDLLVQVGALGYGLLASLALSGRVSVSEVSAAVEYSRRPRPPIALGSSIGECGASASTDNSDGWVASLYSISDASRVKIVLERALVDERVAVEAEKLGLSLEELLYSAEDYNMAVVASPRAAECLLEACVREGVEYCGVVGRVEEGRGVYLESRLLPREGWAWF
ncbi:MAG: AIR synthase related protein [Acidilobaceae archaeon]